MFLFKSAAICRSSENHPHQLVAIVKLPHGEVSECL
ncbi:hypothetical protein SESI111939_09905 [Serratia silvae]